MQIGNIPLKNNLILAPMAGVTDSVFRSICVRFGAALTFTEMVSAKGLSYQSKNTKILLRHSSSELTGAQLFGSVPEIMAQQAASSELSVFDFIDINMGCPAKKITGNGEGSALMRDLPLAHSIIKTVVNATEKPITVKMRIGWDNDSINAVQLALLAQDAGAAAVTIHGRTREQGYSGKADLEIIKQVKKALNIPVIGNGDIYSGKDAEQMLDYTGCDAVMIARGVQGRPWVFAEVLAYLNNESAFNISWQEKLDIALEHGKELAQTRGERTAMLHMRKHMSWYCSGHRGISAFREKINTLSHLIEFEQLINALRKLED